MQLSIHPWKLETKDNLVRRNRSITTNESLPIVSANEKKRKERKREGRKGRRKGISTGKKRHFLDFAFEEKWINIQIAQNMCKHQFSVRVGHNLLARKLLPYGL